MAKGLSYFIPPELREFGKNAYELAKTIRPFQGEDLPVYDSNKSFGKNMLDMATGIGTLALDFGTLGTASAPQKIALKIAEEAAKSGTKTGVKTVDDIIDEGISSSKKVYDKGQTFKNISERLKLIDFNKLDPSKSDEVFKIINQERINQGLPELVVAAGKSPDSSVIVKKLFERGFIDQKTFDNIKDYSQKRYEIGIEKGRESAAKVKNIQTKNRSDKAIELINKLQEGRDTPLVMTSEIFIEKLKEFAPDLFKGTYKQKTNRNKLISQLSEYNPEIKNFLAKPGQKVDSKTLTISETKVREPRFLSSTNPTLDERLDYVRNIEELYGNIINKKAIKIIKAHALGEGKVIDLYPKDIVALEKKIKYVPNKFLEEIKQPTFFLTHSGNDTHRVIENGLVNTLVDKYQKLGYKFVDDAEMPWIKPEKEIDLSLPKNKDLAVEIKNLNKKIDKFKGELKKLNAYTLFYNPVKDKMVSYGQEISKIPGLANIVTKVKKGDLDLKDGGIVGISHLTRPLGNF
jgi:hypothetical protein